MPTQRIQIDLSRYRKTFFRLSTETSIEELLRRVCQQQSIDPTLFSIRASAGPHIHLDKSLTIHDVGTTVFCLIRSPTAGAQQKSLVRTVSSESSPMPFSKDPIKKKRGFFDLFKSSKKYSYPIATDIADKSTQEANVVLSVRSETPISPNSTSSSVDSAQQQQQQQRQKSKKRPAPLPPTPLQPFDVDVDEAKNTTNTSNTTYALVEDGVKLAGQRPDSASSGYHENESVVSRSYSPGHQQPVKVSAASAVIDTSSTTAAIVRSHGKARAPQPPQSTPNRVEETSTKVEVNGTADNWTYSSAVEVAAAPDNSRERFICEEQEIAAGFEEALAVGRSQIVDSNFIDETAVMPVAVTAPDTAQSVVISSVENGVKRQLRVDNYVDEVKPVKKTSKASIIVTNLDNVPENISDIANKRSVSETKSETVLQPNSNVSSLEFPQTVVDDKKVLKQVPSSIVQSYLPVQVVSSDDHNQLPLVKRQEVKKYNDVKHRILPTNPQSDTKIMAFDHSGKAMQTDQSVVGDACDWHRRRNGLNDRLQMEYEKFQALYAEWQVLSGKVQVHGGGGGGDETMLSRFPDLQCHLIEQHQLVQQLCAIAQKDSLEIGMDEYEKKKGNKWHKHWNQPSSDSSHSSMGTATTDSSPNRSPSPLNNDNTKMVTANLTATKHLQAASTEQQAVIYQNHQVINMSSTITEPMGKLQKDKKFAKETETLQSSAIQPLQANNDVASAQKISQPTNENFLRRPKMGNRQQKVRPRSVHAILVAKPPNDEEESIELAFERHKWPSTEDLVVTTGVVTPSMLFGSRKDRNGPSWRKSKDMTKLNTSMGQCGPSLSTNKWRGRPVGVYREQVDSYKNEDFPKKRLYSANVIDQAEAKILDTAKVVPATNAGFVWPKLRKVEKPVEKIGIELGMVVSSTKSCANTIQRNYPTPVSKKESFSMKKISVEKKVSNNDTFMEGQICFSKEVTTVNGNKSMPVQGPNVCLPSPPSPLSIDTSSLISQMSKVKLKAWTDEKAKNFSKENQQFNTVSSPREDLLESIKKAGGIGSLRKVKNCASENVS